MTTPGFCIFGIGDCGSEADSKSLTLQQLDKVRSVVSEIISNTTASSTVSAKNYQRVHVTAKKNIIISGIDMEQYAIVKDTTNLDIKKALSTESAISDIIDTAGDVANKAIAKSAGIAPPKAKTYTETQEKFLTSIKEQYKNIIDTTNIFACLSDVLNQQLIDLKSRKESVIVKGIHMGQAIDSMSSCSIRAILNISKKIKIDSKTISKLKAENQAIVQTAGVKLSTLGWIASMPIILISSIIVILIISSMIKSIVRRDDKKDKIVKDIHKKNIIFKKKVEK